MTADFWSALLLWQRITQYGLPHADGWADTPAAVFDTVELFDGALARIKERERENGRTYRRA